MTTSALINVMSAAAIKAGKGLVRDFGEVDQLHISKKGTANFVTKSDMRTEKLLQKELSIARPGFGFLMEEAGEIAGSDNEYRWIIDPLDGTSNFIHNIPYFCISIAAEKLHRNGDRETIAGVIFDPIHNELFTAEKGKGAQVNNRKLYVSRRDNLEDAMLVTGNLRPSQTTTPEARALYNATSKMSTSLRYLGAAALDLAYLAAGRVDSCWYYTIQPWDIAAGMLMVTEAGGVLTDLGGKSVNAYTGNILASNGLLHGQLQKVISQAA